MQEQQELMLQLCQQLGEETFLKLSDGEKLACMTELKAIND